MAPERIPNQPKENTMTTINIDGVDYVRADTITDHSDSENRIVILQRGNVMIGRYRQDGDMCTLDQASVIRRWGTTKGLGELRAGPTGDTVLDPAGHVEFHVLAMVASISVSADWPLP
jgi:hypothetical protein